MINKESPKVFISYSWEDEEHKKWVKNFVDKLLENGINAQVDQYDVTYGDRLPQFMEEQISYADYVLIICTERYKVKADNRTSGVGYEGHIISGELLTKHNERKFIPILRRGIISTSLPIFLQGKLAIDLSRDEHYEDNFKDLITTLYGYKKKPNIGKAPNYILSEDNLVIDTDEVKILGIVTDEVTVPPMDGSRGSALYRIPFKLSKQPSSLWKELFIRNWNSPPSFTLMHRPGIASVFLDKIILDGTTIDEVQKYHRDTLVLCVEKSNKEERQILEREKQKQEQEKSRINDHYKKVKGKANEIKF